MKLFECSIIKKLFYFISLLFLIKCDNDDKCSDCVIDINNICSCSTSNCKCDIYCRPNLYSGNKCYYCPYERRNFLNPYKISNEKCLVLDECTNKLTYENNQCVDNCGDNSEFGFSLGDYCFKTCDHSNLGIGPTPSLEKECKCERFYTTLVIDGKTYINCVNECPYYYDENTNECKDTCEGENFRIQGEKCKTICEYDKEFLYIEGNKYYCLDKCPEQQIFYYLYKNPTKEDKCVSECELGDVYSTEGSEKYECKPKTSCGKMTLVDINENIYQCSSLEYPTPTNIYVCPESFPYQYKYSCLRTCEDTEKDNAINFFGDKKPTFSLITRDADNNEITGKFCSEDCSEDEHKIFKDLTTHSCYKSCKETSNKFYRGKECINSCQFPYEYHMKDGKCVKDCNDPDEIIDGKQYYLVLEDKACYEKCPENSEYKYYNTKYINHCTTCNKPTNSYEIKYGEGYIIEKQEDGEPITTKLYCYDTPQKEIGEGEQSYYFRRYNDNILLIINSCEDIDYKYTIGSLDANDENKYICYYSCKDIPGNYLYQYGNNCYNEKQVDLDDYSNNYYIESGITHYLISDDEESFLKDNGYFYKRQIETEVYQYVIKCDEDEYILPHTTDKFNKITEFGKCLLECPTVEGKKYCRQCFL